jgi:ribose/xylose/arabinose/galactoside ABC-type transport system permease subunit
MNVLKRVLKARVSIILFILCIGFVVGYFVTGENYTPFLAIMALFIVFTTVEKSRFIEKVDEVVNDPEDREYLNFPLYRNMTKRKPTMFASVVNWIIIAGTIFIFILFFARMIGRPLL